MRLFNKLSKTQSIDPSSFKGVLLKRLSIMEAIAATKFPNLASVNDPAREKIVIDNTREKCCQRGYTDIKTASILQIFIASMTLAKLIQTACITEWGQSSVESIRALGLTSAQKIISEPTNEGNLLRTLRSYITGITDEMLNALDSVATLDSLNDLEDLLIHCFSLIDKQALAQAILIINREIESLKSNFFYIKKQQREKKIVSALREGDIKELTHLIKTHQMNVNQPCSMSSGDWTFPISYAASVGNLEMLHLFLSVPDINLNVADSYGEILIMCAIRSDHEQVVRELLKHARFDRSCLSTSFDVGTCNPLLHTIIYGKYRILREMLVYPEADILAYKGSWLLGDSVLSLVGSGFECKGELGTMVVLLEHYFHLMLHNKENIRQKFIEQPRLLADLSNYDAQLWKTLLSWAQSFPEPALRLLQEIHDSEKYEKAEQHPLYMIFSKKYISTFQYIGTFFSSEEDIMNKIKMIIQPNSKAPGCTFSESKNFDTCSF